MRAATDGGSFGRWSSDGSGFPCFDLDASVFENESLVLPAGGASSLWHQVGNDVLTATAHAGGDLTLYAFEGGPVALTGRGGGGVAWRLLSGGRVLADSRRGAPDRVRWGAGFAEWARSGGGATVRRKVTAPVGDVPALIVEVEICSPEPAEYVEEWCFRPYPLVPGLLMSAALPDTGPGERRAAALRVMFAASRASRAITELSRRLAGRTMALAPVRLEGGTAEAGGVLLVHRGGRRRARGRARPLARVSKLVPRLERDVLVNCLGETAPLISCTSSGPLTTVTLSHAHRGGTTSFAFAVGLTARRGPGRPVPRIEGHQASAGPGWAGACSVEIARSPSAGREAAWHFYHLRSARVVEDSAGPYIPQGSAYGFVHGAQGAPRDYAFSAVALAYLFPPAAAELLRLMCRLMKPSGEMYYAHAGAGVRGSGFVHRFPTDLPLFFLWALAEYVWASGDRGFLDERVPFGLRATGGGTTVRGRALSAWHRVVDDVGIGSHGMLQVGAGDWNDPLALMVRDSRAFRREGESGFNTSLGAYVLPLAADLLSADEPAESSRMRAFGADLSRAMESAWNGRWFLRGWDGRGAPLGRDHLFLDTQVWCLLAGIGGSDRCSELALTIHRLCEKPSPIGATVLDRPHHVRFGILPSGWDCNGGVWAAVNALLAWGYALRKPELAWQCLERQSLARHASAYPHLWLGTWSGPDSYNSHMGCRPGETFVHPATPMMEFPVMNSNAHAGPLLALLKVLGVEAGPEGPRIAPRGPGSPDAWSISTPYLLARREGDYVEISRKTP